MADNKTAYWSDPKDNFFIQCGKTLLSVGFTFLVLAPAAILLAPVVALLWIFQVITGGGTSWKKAASPFGNLVKSMVMPAYRKYHNNEPVELPQQNSANVHVSQIATGKSDLNGNPVILDCIHIIPPDTGTQQDPAHMQHVMYFTGNCGIPTNCMHRMLRLSQELGCSIFLVNYRGIGNNTKNELFTPDELVQDTVDVVKHLVDNGLVASADHLTLVGHSLGASFSTEAGAKLHEQGYKVKVFNRASFATLAAVATDMLSYGTIMNFITYPIAYVILFILGWNINAVDAYKKIPNEYKEHISIQGDKILGKGALHNGLDADQQSDQHHVFKLINNSDDSSHRGSKHNASLKDIVNGNDLRGDALLFQFLSKEPGRQQVNQNQQQQPAENILPPNPFPNNPLGGAGAAIAAGGGGNVGGRM